MMGKERVVLEMSLMSEIHLEWEVRSLADYILIRDNV